MNKLWFEWSAYDVRAECCMFHNETISLSRCCLIILSSSILLRPVNQIHQTPLSMFVARILKWVANSFPRGTSWPRDFILIFLQIHTSEPLGTAMLLPECWIYASHSTRCQRPTVLVGSIEHSWRYPGIWRRLAHFWWNLERILYNVRRSTLISHLDWKGRACSSFPSCSCQGYWT